mgnify:CR=1 FL=1
MGTLRLSVAEVELSYDDLRHFNRVRSSSKRWEARVKRKPLYPTFIKACRKAEGTIPTLEEFNQLWPPEKDKLVYVQAGA